MMSAMLKIRRKRREAPRAIPPQIPPQVLPADPAHLAPWTNNDDIYRYLCWHLQMTPRTDAWWVMSPDWLKELERRFSPPPQPAWPEWVPVGEPPPPPSPAYVLGLPVNARDGAGVPHLEQL